MPIYLLTLHAYRSWTEDNPRGYVQRGRPGIQSPQPRLAQYRARIAKHPSARLDRAQMHLSLDVTREVCENLNHGPLAGSCTATHLHALVSVLPQLALPPYLAPPLRDGARRDGAWFSMPSDIASMETTVDALCARIKSVVGCRLSQRRGTTDNRWFSRGKDATAVRNREHLEYLIETYLPRHERNEGGVFVRWCGAIDW